MNIKEIKMNLLPAEFASLNLRDPITNQRLSHAVVIVPCGCRVNEDTVKQICIIAKNKVIEVPANTPCPVCLKGMQSLFADEWMRNFVAGFFESVGKQGCTLNIPKENFKKWVGPIPEYPQGPRGDFIQKGEEKYGNDMFRFKSTTQSPLCTMNLTAAPYQRYIYITYEKNCGFQDYLWAQGMELSDLHKQQGCFYSSDLAEISKLFELIAANNNFDEKEIQLIRTKLNAPITAVIKIAKM